MMVAGYKGCLSNIGPGVGKVLDNNRPMLDEWYNPVYAAHHEGWLLVTQRQSSPHKVPYHPQNQK
eukprot:15340253-Ditylum_brightwellii.AAC.2